MSTKHRKMVYDHLNNNQIYKKTDRACDKELTNKIIRLTQKYQNVLTKLEIDYLTNFSVSTRSFYNLPKIHKSALTSEAVAKQNSEYVKVLEPN